MVWDLSLDDFNNVCGEGVNPLLNAIKSGLETSSPSSSSVSSVQPDPLSTTISVTPSDIPSISVETDFSTASMTPSPNMHGKKRGLLLAHLEQNRTCITSVKLCNEEKNIKCLCLNELY